MTYDALLVLSFGGPEGPDDVMPFLENVTRGRGVPPERLAGVAEHYLHFGGVSPINAQNRALIEALRVELDAHGIDLPIYWGNRNWHPFVTDTVRTMTADGIPRALVFVTSAYGVVLLVPAVSGRPRRRRRGGRCGCAGARQAAALLRPPGVHRAPGRCGSAAVAAIDPARRATTRLVFTAHSIPTSMAAQAGPGRRSVRRRS